MAKLPDYKEKMKNQPFKFAFIALLILALIVNLSIYKDFSITNDEPIHHLHGQIILDYYLGKDSTAGLSPMDDDGKLIQTFLAARDEKIRGMNFFGGLPDLLVAIAVRAFPNADEYHIRHLCTSFWGLLALIFVGLLARLISNWRAAFLAVLILWLSPRFLGHSFYNPKDIPFAAIYITSIYLILRFIRELPHTNFKLLTVLILVLGMSISIRVSGLMLIAFFAMSVFAWWLLTPDSGILSKKHLDKGIPLFIMVILTAFLSYLSTSFFWPYAAENIWGPITIFPQLSKFELFNSYEIYFGKWYNSWENPWHYGIVWTFITLPLTYLIGFFLIPLLFYKTESPAKNPFRFIAIMLILFAAIFPLVYVILNKSVIYNEARHLLFVVPAFAVLTALSFDRFFKLISRTHLYYFSIAVFVIFTYEPAKWMWSNHPLQGMYFSPLTGRIEGAFKRFEFDYWGVSTLPALRWISENSNTTEQNPGRVKMFYGESIKVTHFMDRYFKNLVFAPGNAKDNWDYQIQYTVAAKFDSNLLFNWPPKGTIHEIKAGNAPIAAVIRNPHHETLRDLETRLSRAAVSSELINIGLEYYYLDDFHNSIRATRRAMEYEPENAIIWNNLCAAYNKLQMYELAVAAGNKALRINPEFNLARANLEISVEGMKNLENNPRSARDFLNLSYYLYLQEDYHESIKMCYAAIAREPDNALAYNNLCSVYNVIGEYKKAKKACEKALELNPDFTLAANNLRESIKGLERQGK